MAKRLFTVVLVLIALYCAPCGSLPGGAEAQAATEGFESGNLNSLPWTTGGDSSFNWGVTTGGYTGTYAAAAPAELTIGQSSFLLTSLDMPFGGDVSFWYRVSSAPGDSLKFYVDDMETPVGEWSGEIPWVQFTSSVLAGPHTFKWVYTNNSGEPAGRNRAWIDDIVFPDADVPTYSIDTSVVGGNGSFACDKTTSVLHGENVTCSITPASNYHLETIVDNGVDMWSRALSGSYTINTLAANHIVVVTFANEADNIETFETRNLRKFPWATGWSGELGSDPNPVWSVTTASGYAGGYAAEAPKTLDAFQKSYLKINLFMPTDGEITFRYRVSSEDFMDSDYLQFYVDGVPTGAQMYGEIPWTEVPVRHTLTAGAHTITWEYSKDGSGDGILDTAWIDDIVFPAYAVFDLNETSNTETFETGDFTKFPWSFSGEQQWNVSGTAGYNSYFAAVSPSIKDNQSSSLETKLYIPATGNLTFRYKVSSEVVLDEALLPVAGDFLRFYIDDMIIPKGSWAGDTGWQQAIYQVSEGNHTFRWEYSKDDTESKLEDKAWIDEIVFPGATYKPEYTVKSSVVGDLGGTISCVPVVVNHGIDSVCTITPDTGYSLVTLIDNSVNKTNLVSGGSYAISNVMNDRTIAASFVSNSYVEDFETGNFFKLPWNYSGPWSVTNSSRHTGSYAAQVIGGTSSTLQTTLTVPIDCNMSFWYRVSSRPDVDFLRFYIDGIEPQGTGWSGESPWAQRNIGLVPAGRHTFRWVYVKDSSDFAGSDSAWIDDIVVPGAADLPVKLVNGVSRDATFKPTLQQAYDDAGIENNDEIILPETFAAGRLTAGVTNKVVTIKGGYDDTLTNASSNSTSIAGKMTVKAGTVRVERIKVK